LLALAQQPAHPVNSSQDQTVGQTEPGANAEPKKSTSSNATDKAESLSTEHNTDLQGGSATKSTKHAKKGAKSKTAKNKTAAKSKKAQGRSPPLPEASPPPSSENATGNVERESGKGKGRQQPKPLGEKSNQ
jgi:hypothetical protein